MMEDGKEKPTNIFVCQKYKGSLKLYGPIKENVNHENSFNDWMNTMTSVCVFGCVCGNGKRVHLRSPHTPKNTKSWIIMSFHKFMSRLWSEPI